MSNDQRDDIAAQTTAYEQRLIGAAVCSNDIAARMSAALHKDEIFTQWIRRVFVAIKRIVARDGQVNLDSVGLEISRLPDVGLDEQMELTTRLAAAMEPVSNDLADALIGYVHELSFRRRA